MDKNHKIGISLMIIGIIQIIIIGLMMSSVVFRINGDDSASELKVGEEKNLVISHSIIHTNKFILTVGQKFTVIGQPPEIGVITLTNTKTGQTFNFSYNLILTTSYAQYVWESILLELPAGGYIIKDSNSNSDELDYKIINAGFFRNLNVEQLSSDDWEATEIGIFITSIAIIVVFTGIGLHFIKYRKIKDYTRKDDKRKYKLPKRKTPKKLKQLEKKEAFLDDFEKKIQPKETKKDKWEWD